jgi:hypothetical protein
MKKTRKNGSDPFLRTYHTTLPWVGGADLVPGSISVDCRLKITVSS